jgi:hypothetical protein
MSRSTWKYFLILLISVFIAPVLATLADSDQDQLVKPMQPDRNGFRMWLARSEIKQGETAGLYPYYVSEEEGFESSGDDFISPMVSAKCILYWLAENDIGRAVRTAEGLLYWQEVAGKNVHANAVGALPSQIVWDGTQWVCGDRYYSGDNLLVLKALMSLYKLTFRDDLLQAAEQIAGWLRDVMCHGENFGAWLECYFAPMNFITAGGDYDNRIFTGMEFLWLRAFRDFGEITADSSYIQHYTIAKSFLMMGQSEHGVWFDHYDPGYPPQYYATQNWKWYGEGGVVVGDNALRAALGAYHAGEYESVLRFAGWLRPQDGAVFAYLDAATGEERFLPSTDPYFDIVVSGLWRDLASKLGMDKAVISSEQFLSRTQSPDGGWYWGRRQHDLSPIQKSAAILTGYWAVSKHEE